MPNRQIASKTHLKKRIKTPPSKTPFPWLLQTTESWFYPMFQSFFLTDDRKAAHVYHIRKQSISARF